MTSPTDNSRVDDGGPAFPGSSALSPKGMSLRDWLAGQALNALAGLAYAKFAADPAGTDKQAAQALARAAYFTADAMLAARKGGDK